MCKKVYPYHDASGKKVFEKIRVEKDGGKSFYIVPKLDDVIERPLYHLPQLIQAVRTGIPVFIVEGERDVETLEKIGYAATCNFDGGGAGKWKSGYNQYFVGANVIVMTDIDTAGNQLADDIVRNLCPIAKQVIKIDLSGYGVDLPPNGDITDLVLSAGEEKVRTWLDNIVADPVDRNGVEMYHNPWIDPQPLSTSTKPVPYNVMWLPDNIRSYVTNTAKLLQVPTEMIANTCISIMSYLLSKCYYIEVRPGWVEPSNLYILTSAPSGERKSVVVSRIVKPLLEYESKWNSDHAIAIKESKRDHARLLTELQHAMEKEKSGESTADEVEKCREVLQNHNIIYQKRMIADDITPEKLTTLLAKNNGKILIISGEASFLEVIGGRYSNKISLDIALKGYSGEAIRVDRASRDEDIIDDPALSMCIFTQPIMAESVYSNEVYSNRGLLARILLSCPQSLIGTRSFLIDEPDANDNDWAELCNFFLSTADEKPAVETIKFDAEARCLMGKIYDRIEQMLAIDENETLRSFDAKLCGHIARLALVLHFMGYKSPLEDIDSKTLQSAADMGFYFRSQLLSMLSQLGADNTTKTAQKILAKLKNEQINTTTEREIKRFMQSLEADEQAKVIGLLVDKGWIRRADDTTHVGRPSVKYEINPLLRENM